MVVEVFEKGSNFKKLKDVYWGVKSIQYDGMNLTLIFYPAACKESCESMVINGDECEIRACS